ncbi:MAG TPA: CAP domain-containing protein [Roseiflexaceae bacterium]|nr:CAP domain-containing protein [Roseiflexaceae bacterium]
MAAPAGMRAASSNIRVYLPLMTRTAAAVSVEQRVAELTNEQRRQQGCMVALVLSPELSVAASAHSRDMALHDRFSHTGSDGSTMVSRAQAAGYDYSGLAENLAAGPTTPEEVVAGWMNSPGHRANILNCALREIGVGYYEQSDDQSNVRLDSGQLSGPYRHYWTQDLGAR